LPQWSAKHCSIPSTDLTAVFSAKYATFQFSYDGTFTAAFISAVEQSE